MRGFIITGTSSGIGYELCKLLLNNTEHKVIGISRTQNIEHTNYHHIALDLNNISEIESIDFPSWSNAEQVSLIHNAGWIGPIQKIGNQELGAIASAYIINLVAPAVLSSQFISIYKSSKAEKVILSVSSGAADSGIEGWGESTPFGSNYIAAHAKGVRAGIEEIAPTLLGKDPRQLDRINEVMDNALIGHNHAKTPLDVACWDIFGKSVEMPVCDLLGAVSYTHLTLPTKRIV